MPFPSMFKKTESSAQHSLNGTDRPLPPDTDARVKRLATITSVSAFVATASLIFAVVTNGQSNAAVAAVQENMTTTVVAAKDIPCGTTIKESMLTTAQVPAQYVSQNAITELQDAIGKQATVRIDANCQVRGSELSGKETSSSLATKLSKGKKAVSIDVSTASDFARSLLHQGDKVSLFCFQAQEDGSKKKLRLAKDVPVLALDGYISYADLSGSQEGSVSYSNITVEVDGKTAEEIRQNQDEGNTIWLILTAASDTRN